MSKKELPSISEFAKDESYRPVVCPECNGTGIALVDIEDSGQRPKKCYYCDGRKMVFEDETGESDSLSVKEMTHWYRKEMRQKVLLLSDRLPPNNRAAICSRLFLLITKVKCRWRENAAKKSVCDGRGQRLPGF